MLSFISLLVFRLKKKALYLSVKCIKHESANWGHYIYVSYWRRDRHFTWSSEPWEGPAACRAKAVPSFLSYFKTVSIVPAPGIEPATSRSAVKHSTDLANPAAVYDSNNAQMTVIDHPFLVFSLTMC